MNNFGISLENLNVKRVYKTRKQFLRKISFKISVKNVPQSVVTGKGWLRESHINFTFNYSSEVHLLVCSVSHFCVMSPCLGMVKASLTRFTANAARGQSQPQCRAGSEQR